MRTLTLKDTLTVMQRTLNSIDGRLTNHGKQTAYLCMRMGRAMGYSENQLFCVCVVAMLHDIGAYKVEERKRLGEFEVEYPHEHAVYGALFMREFSPLSDMADIVLYHHWRYENRSDTSGAIPVPDESFLIHLADRVSVLYARFGCQLKEAITRHIPPLSGREFDPVHAESLIRLVEETDLIDAITSGAYLDDVFNYFGGLTLSPDEVAAYLSTLVYAIDFRSRSTVTHSVSVVSAADQICRLLGLPDSERNTCCLAALLHDVGKITTPLEILTKPGRLTDEDMEIMRNHVVVTEEILTAAGLHDINAIASYHHERLDGSGYPHHAKGSNLCLGARILCVADILTALVEPRYYKPRLPKEDVLAIMGKSVSLGHLDAHVYGIVRDNFDQILSAIEAKQRDMLSIYDMVSLEYTSLTEELYQAANVGILPERLDFSLIS